MQTARRAVIDVGTNSVKLLVADVAGREVQPVWEESKQTRLGRGFYETRRLRSDAIDATGKAVAQFRETARKYEASSVRVIATSAARDAVNADELSAAIEKGSGLKMEIISGEQEADWVFQGVTTDPTLAGPAGQMLMLLDVGGGSTEFIMGLVEYKFFQQSYPIGTVRLLEKYPPSDPPTGGELARCREWLRNFLEKEAIPQIDFEKLCDVKGWDGSMRLVGTGGTTSILGRMEAKLETYDRAKIEATRLSRERVQWHVEHLWSLPLEERKHVVGLPPNRADVILMGVAIYEAVMEAFGFRELRISTRGLRFAAVMEPKE